MGEQKPELATVAAGMCGSDKRVDDWIKMRAGESRPARGDAGGRFEGRLFFGIRVIWTCSLHWSEGVMAAAE